MSSIAFTLLALEIPWETVAYSYLEKPATFAMMEDLDTLFLAKIAKQVYAFDIQEQALEKTQERLDQAGMTNAQLILQGHETLDQFVTEAKAGIFNLGYLPSADKSVITRPQTTIEH